MIDIPTRTFITRPTPEIGQGPGHGGGAKHIAITSGFGKTWWLGGDYNGGGGYPQSGRNELWSLDAESWRWTLETPYVSDSMQPSGPDQVGWVWDEKRRLFWMIPGYMWNRLTVAPNSVLNRFMSFDPATKQWAIANRAEFTSPGSHTYAALDPISDCIYEFGMDSNLMYLSLADPGSVWVNKKFTLPRTVRCGRSYHTVDPIKQILYGFDLESTIKSLWQYDIKSQKMTEIPGLILAPDSGRVSPVWDSVNSLLYIVQSYGPEARIKLDVYHPNTGTFESIPIVQPEGIIPKGINCVFDPAQNVLIVGCTNNASPVPYYFLFRYAASTAETPTAPVITRVSV